MQELQTLGAALIELSEARLAALALPERLVDAIRAARNTKTHEGKRRQLQYVGRLMRDDDLDAETIAAQLHAWQLPARTEVRLHGQIERWRERLMQDEGVFAELAASFPHADVAQVRALVAQAHWEQENGKAPKSHRELFRLLSSVVHDAGDLETSS